MLDTMQAVVLAASAFSAGALVMRGWAAMRKWERRREAPVPCADYDRDNPINQGGGRWHPSRVHDVGSAVEVRAGSGYVYVGTSEFGTEWYEARPLVALEEAVE